MSKEEKEKILNFIEEEMKRISFGKLLIEITIRENKVTHIQCETKRTMPILEKMV